MTIGSLSLVVVVVVLLDSLDQHGKFSTFVENFGVPCAIGSTSVLAQTSIITAHLNSYNHQKIPLTIEWVSPTPCKGYRPCVACKTSFQLLEHAIARSLTLARFY